MVSSWHSHPRLPSTGLQSVYRADVDEAGDADPDPRGDHLLSNILCVNILGINRTYGGRYNP